MDNNFNVKEVTYDLICVLESRDVEYYVDLVCGDLYLSIPNTGIEIKASKMYSKISVHNSWVTFGEEEFMYFDTVNEFDRWVESQVWGHKH